MANMTNEEAKDIFITNRMIGDFKLRDAIDVAVKALNCEQFEDCIRREEVYKLLPSYRFKDMNAYLEVKASIDKLSSVQPMQKMGK